MKLTPKLFAATVLGLTGLAIYVLYVGSQQEDRTDACEFPPFQTIGENRILNVFRRRKVPTGHRNGVQAIGNRAAPVPKADNAADPV